MFSLNYEIDDVFKINEKEYKANGNFDNILRIIDMLQESRLTKAYKYLLGLKMFFGDKTDLVALDPLSQEEIFHEVYQSYVEKQEEAIEYDLQGNPIEKNEGNKKQDYSLKHDAPYIYASFVQAYKIDLIEEQGKLHWFKFQALLEGLPEDTKFRQVISYRTWKPSKGDSPKHKEQMRKLQKLYRLPGTENDIAEYEEEVD